MYTRASSIRSNYTTTSTKAKFNILPQRIVGGNDSIQHYNALHIADTPVVKNNNVMNGNHNWTVKSSWPFNQSSVVANGTVVEWQDKKCVCFSKIYNNKHSMLEPIANNVNTVNATKNCCCCQGRKTICKDSILDSELCCMSKAADWEQVNLCKAECSNNRFKCDERDDDDDIDDTDFRNEIIRINNIYNNCNANANGGANTESMANDNFHVHGFNNSCISLNKYKSDINL